jgi:hypothetical protein
MSPTTTDANLGGFSRLGAATHGNPYLIGYHVPSVRERAYLAELCTRGAQKQAWLSEFERRRLAELQA